MAPLYRVLLAQPKDELLLALGSVEGTQPHASASIMWALTEVTANGVCGN